MNDHVTMRLFFADCSALLVRMSVEDARRDVYVHHAIVDRGDPLVVQSVAVALRKQWLAVPAGCYGPLEGDIVHVERDDVAGARASAARDLGPAEAERVLPDRAGWRYVAVFVEDGAQ